MTETRKRPSGRPREFQPSEVAQSALQAFWAGGFHEVSVPDLEDATGVVRTSLYNTFGNKRGLFDAALEAYLGQLFADIDSMLTEATGGLDDIHRFLDTLEGWHLSGIPGCFMINSMVEFADRDPQITTRGEGSISTSSATASTPTGSKRCTDPLTTPSHHSDARVMSITVVAGQHNTIRESRAGCDVLAR